MGDKKLKQLIKEQQVILFVGAGISATVGLPTWSKLISHISKELGYDIRIFEKYGDNLLLAEFYQYQKENLNELINWMKKKWEISGEIRKKITKSNIYKYIVELDFPIIYTTNYDQCLEEAFKLYGKPYKRIVDVNDLVKSESKAERKTQIVKFHGDINVEKNESIVLTESSYFKRLSFESPLDIKLRADMLGKSILFIGYSLSDINIRFLIYKLNEIWEKGDSSRRPKSYVFFSTPNPVQEKILENRGIDIIVGELDKTKSIEHFLKKLR